MSLKQNILYKNYYPAPDYSGSPAGIKAIFSRHKRTTSGSPDSSYAKGAIISFNLCKLGANFVKINSAPLEEEIYVVANTFLLDGKEVTIKIKEKEDVLVTADADLNVLEAKENGAQITTLKATVEKNIAKVKIKLRPKADADLKTWKEKLVKGKKGVT